MDLLGSDVGDTEKRFVDDLDDDLGLETKGILGDVERRERG